MIFDLVVLAAILISSLIAFLRGFIREVLTILGVIGGTAAAVALGPKLTPVVAGWLDHHKKKAEAGEAGADAGKHADKLFGIVPYDIAAELIAYGGVFIVVVIVLSIVSHFLSKGAKKIGLGAVDRTLGVFFGAARAIILLALLYLPIHLMVTDEATLDNWFGDSHTRVYVRATSDWLNGFIPKKAAKDLNAAADKASASMTEATRDKLFKIESLRDKLQQKGGAGQPAYSSASANQPGYGEQQRGQMDSLINTENSAIPAGKAGQR